MIRWCLAVLLGAVCSLSWNASAQELPRAQGDLTPEQHEELNARLTTLIRAAESGPYEFSKGPILLNLREDERRVIEFSVEAGRTYALAGVCDLDCFSFDFEVSDLDGNRIEGVKMDDIDDKIPVAIVTSAQSATRLLEVAMRRCSSRSCSVAVILFVEGS